MSTDLALLPPIPRGGRPGWGARLAIVLALTLSAPVAFAQTAQPTAQELETARTLYKEGKELRAAGDLRGALEKLRAAHALGHTPVTGVELAKTYAMVGKLVEAREVALSVARLGVASDETEKSADARAESAKLAEELRPRIPTLAVRVRGLTPGEVPLVIIDGVQVPAAASAEPQKVDPGKHEIVVRVGEGAAAREVRAGAETPEGQMLEIAVDVPPAPAPAPPPPPPGGPPPDPSYRTPLLAKLAFGVAVGGTVVGIVAGIEALSYENSVSGECPSSHRCVAGTQGANDLGSAHTWANVSTVSFVLAGAGLVTGVVDMFVEQGHHAREAGAVRVAPWVGVGSAGVRGQF